MYIEVSRQSINTEYLQQYRRKASNIFPNYFLLIFQANYKYLQERRKRITSSTKVIPCNDCNAIFLFQSNSGRSLLKKLTDQVEAVEKRNAKRHANCRKMTKKIEVKKKELVLKKSYYRNTNEHQSKLFRY